MPEYVNKTALEKRRLRMLAKASESRTVSHDAIEKREARREAQQQTNSFQKHRQRVLLEVCLAMTYLGQYSNNTGVKNERLQ